MKAISRDEYFMRVALDEAEKAAEIGEVPVGAVVVCDGKIIAKAHNTRETDKNALCHAEVKAIDLACKRLGGWRLFMCELYVTLEPCPMCAGAIINARIRRVFFGARDEKAGSLGTKTDLLAVGYNHKPEVTGGLMEEECSRLLSDFFVKLRELKKSHKK